MSGKQRLLDYVRSDENIFLAIYAVKSYVFDVQLLNKEDKQLLHRLADPFDGELIRDTINSVRETIDSVLKDEATLFEVQVYMKPKKIVEENGETKRIYRHLHTSRLKTLIAMVALLHTLIYEIPSKKQNYKLNLSNYSKLIPNNFYGNRVSCEPENLFFRWNDQYKLYTEKANEYFATFHKTQECRYEVKLDLKNFFPSINPCIVYNMLLATVPVTIGDSNDLEIFKRIIKKLLVCQVTNLDTVEAKEIYYGLNHNDSITLAQTKGIAQGLPQSYFFGNICMIKIAEIFEEKFQGKSVYYVDDSYIYTNEPLDQSKFQHILHDINTKIEEFEKSFNNDDEWRGFLKKICAEQMNTAGYYGIRVHNEEKGMFSDISQVKSGEFRIKKLSREASDIGNSMFSTYSQEEDESLLRRIKLILGVVEKELMENMSSSDADKASYVEKLIRYRKFFQYRALKLELKVENRITDKLFKVLTDGELNGAPSLDCLKKGISAEQFFRNFKEDIWLIAVSILINNFSGEQEKSAIVDYLKSVIAVSYDADLMCCCYLQRIYSSYMEGENEVVDVNAYSSISKAILNKMRRLISLNNKALRGEFDGVLLRNIGAQIIDSYDLCSQYFINTSNLVIRNSERLQRMFLNALYSSIFKIEPSDEMMFNARDKKCVTYGILRVLAYLRNPNFKLNYFLKWDIDIFGGDNLQKMDYIMFEVLDIFKTYVSNPEYIDNLIMIHRYVCEIWKNGAKHLYFYTLHNQEHAIDLIKNVVKIVKVVSYLKISQYDYYIVFLSCYLHDISMVRIAAESDFLLDKSESEQIVTRAQEKLKGAGGAGEIKKIFSGLYRDIDGFYERIIRSEHAINSANEIRNLSELNFLGDSTREHVAEVSEAHCADVRDIYYVRGEAKARLISIKFDKIILRLADLLDMSANRVSKPILNRNLDNMSSLSAFHWVSHLLTEGYELTGSYETKKENINGLFAPNSLVENLNLTIFVKLSQLSKISPAGCKFCKLSEDGFEGDGLRLQITNGDTACSTGKCNFLCKWFNAKHHYLMQELSELQKYLGRIPADDRIYETQINVCVKVTQATSISQEQFEVLKRKVNG